MTETSTQITDIKPEHRHVWRCTYRRHFLDPFNDIYARCASLLMEIMSALDIPEYLHETSNHLFSHRQKIALLVIMEMKRLSFRRFEEEADSFIPVFRAIGLNKCPHYSTLCKFRLKLDRKHLDRITTAFTAVVQHPIVVPIDGTSEANYDRSAHYEARMDDFGKKFVNTFTKISLAVDADSKIIIGCETDAEHYRKHDVKDVPALIRKVKESNVTVSHVVADRGYDSEEIHCIIEEELDAMAVIPIRVQKKNVINGEFKTKGRHRKIIKKLLLKDTELMRIYNRRSLVETVNFMLKKNLGGHIAAKLAMAREIVVKLRVIGHNLLRIHRLNKYRSMEV